MNFEQLFHTASTYNKKDWIPQWAPIEIEVYDIREKVASAKVKAIWGFDYILFSKNTDGRWLMDKILWQSYNEKEAKEYFLKLKECNQ